jgi:hypothetical protein
MENIKPIYPFRGVMTERGGFSHWWRLNYHFIAWMLLILGITALVLGSLGAYYDGKDTPPYMEFASEMGGWSYWAITLSILAMFGGGYYVYDHASMAREFKTLIDGKGRVNFIKNLDRIEELAYNLGEIYEKSVIDRKKEFNLK